jgi:hypothetical protein
LPGLLLAQVTSDNAPEGANFTLWFPLGLFIIVLAILWVLYSRPHRRVPPRQTAPAHAGGAAHSAGTGTGQAAAQRAAATSDPAAAAPGQAGAGSASATSVPGASSAADDGTVEEPGAPGQSGAEDTGAGE